MSSKVCPQCFASFSGRVDKKYCTNDCRAEANRLKRRLARQPTILINEILWRNREILRNLWKDRPTMIARETLISEGFKLPYHTGIHITTKGNIYFICYDFGFQPCNVSGSHMALVVKMTSSPLIDAWLPPFNV